MLPALSSPCAPLQKKARRSPALESQEKFSTAHPLAAISEDGSFFLYEMFYLCI